MVNVHMIGNSHIDPVWFWDWSEGMQEVKATFSSVLDRLREDKNLTFTATSSAFFEWIKATSPEMFSEIKRYVNDGRFSITGGWYIEPDCILPCGEAMVRQGLYGQRFFKETLGIKAKIGSNVDSFGHNPSIPQILKKSGMDNYVFMRPRLADTPVFKWESADGSQVKVVSLPSEYTTWFYESTKEGIQMAEAAANQAGLSSIPCCYGVGNHGGGPTKANIQAIYQLQEELPETLLSFSNFKNFFESLTAEESDKLPVRKDFFDKVNTGCFSVDGPYKLLNRETERRLIQTDFMLAIEQMVTGKVSACEGDMAKLWKRLLFNQFHDTLGGTCTKPARDEAAMALAGVCGHAKEIQTLSLQRIVNKINTAGEGFPLFLFNPTGSPFSGTVEVEVDWFCKDVSRAIIKCWFWAIEIVGSFLFIVSFLFLSFHYNFSFDRKVL